MRNWKILVESFNNCVFVRVEGEYIYIKGTNFALEGLNRVLKQN